MIATSILLLISLLGAGHPGRLGLQEPEGRRDNKLAGRASMELRRRPSALLHRNPYPAKAHVDSAEKGTHGRATDRLEDHRRAGKQVSQDVVDPKGRQRLLAADLAPLLLATCPMGQPDCVRSAVASPLSLEPSEGVGSRVPARGRCGGARRQSRGSSIFDERQLRCPPVKDSARHLDNSDGAAVH